MESWIGPIIFFVIVLLLKILGSGRDKGGAGGAGGGCGGCGG